MKRLVLLVLVMSVLSGCVVYPNSHPHDNRNGGFCPPGQAKKGNC
ncbi:hypothetical protein CR155_19765 [Pollutimonas nitritireducens]|uniref:Lipoprotein n=1 Tax=Pollutimonas nitritireducens TaxID=2045209 RepID=A0A2N4UAV6_9BURK|nr:hypothetical protein CR155_19765 [Pollutimonas nitritireducens]